MGKGNGAWPLNMVETSLKVPLIFRWPAGGVAKGATIDARVTHVDMAPTFLALAGVKDGLPRPAGASYADLLRGASRRRCRRRRSTSLEGRARCTPSSRRRAT